jgi:hypothetical protein
MSLSRSVAEVLQEHVTLEVEGIDRMYLNVYVPALQRAGGVASFFRFHLGNRFASSTLMDPITKAFIAQMEQFAKQEKVPMVTFEKGQRKDDVAAAYGQKFSAPEGVLFIGKAQEKTSVFRTERRRNEQTGATYPWLASALARNDHTLLAKSDPAPLPSERHFAAGQRHSCPWAIEVRSAPGRRSGVDPFHPARRCHPADRAVYAPAARMT